MGARVLEVCVDNAEGLTAAIAGGADRIELCSALSLGGLTPSKGLMTLAANAPVPVYAMIRPRSGDFMFSQTELDIMLHDIDAAREAGLAGVVLGVSNDDNRLHEGKLQKLMHHAQGLGTTLHRAVDLVPDLMQAVDLAVALGFERILSSGGKPNAQEGRETLRRMYEHANNRISIMAGSGVTETTAPIILASAPLREMHASCSVSVVLEPSKVTEFGFSNATTWVTSAENVAALKKAIAA